jgi:hypothetical protein
VILGDGTRQQKGLNQGADFTMISGNHFGKGNNGEKILPVASFGQVPASAFHI